MHRIITSLAVIALLALPGASTAFAQSNAGVDEYTEQIPGGKGDNPSSNPEGGGTLAPSQVAALEAQGEDGAAAAALAQSTGPDRDRLDGAAARPDRDRLDGAAADPAATDSGGSAITEVIGDVAGGSDSGMGTWLPIILGATLLGAIAFVVAARGRNQPPNPTA